MVAKTYFSQEALKKLFDMLAEGWSMPHASAVACGVASKAPWCWIRNAKRERESGVSIEQAKHVIKDWPEEGETLWLDDAYKTSQEMMKLNLSSQAIEEVMQLRKPVLDGSGNVSFQLDYKALAEWRGDKELARTLGGLDDPFFAHDESGARIPLTVRAEIPSAMRIAALKATNPAWNVEQKIDVKKRSNDVVLVLGERRREREQQKPDNGLERLDIEELRRLAKLPPKNPRPTGKVDLGNGGRGTNDPPERINNRMGDDAARPLAPALPPPSPQPQPQQPVVSYARRRTAALDATDRATGGANRCGMPPGGFDSKGRPT